MKKIIISLCLIVSVVRAGNTPSFPKETKSLSKDYLEKICALCYRGYQGFDTLDHGIVTNFTDEHGIWYNQVIYDRYFGNHEIELDPHKNTEIKLVGEQPLDKVLKITIRDHEFEIKKRASGGLKLRIMTKVNNFNTVFQERLENTNTLVLTKKYIQELRDCFFAGFRGNATFENRYSYYHSQYGNWQINPLFWQKFKDEQLESQDVFLYFNPHNLQLVLSRENTVWEDVKIQKEQANGFVRYKVMFPGNIREK